MFIALQVPYCALQRSAMCFAVTVYMPLLTERITGVTAGYKYVAPLEQATEKCVAPPEQATEKYVAPPEQATEKYVAPPEQATEKYVAPPEQATEVDFRASLFKSLSGFARIVPLARKLKSD